MQTRFAVGAGVYVANADFMRRYAGMQSFRQTPSQDRDLFYSELNDLELSLRSREPGMALGVGLYRIWLAELLEGRRQAANLLGEELAEMSRKAPRMRFAPAADRQGRSPESGQEAQRGARASSQALGAGGAK